MYYYHAFNLKAWCFVWGLDFLRGLWYTIGGRPHGVADRETGMYIKVERMLDRLVKGGYVSEQVATELRALDPAPVASVWIMEAYWDAYDRYEGGVEPEHGLTS